MAADSAHFSLSCSRLHFGSHYSINIEVKPNGNSVATIQAAIDRGPGKQSQGSGIVAKQYFSETLVLKANESYQLTRHIPDRTPPLNSVFIHLDQEGNYTVKVTGPALTQWDMRNLGKLKFSNCTR